MIAYLNGRLQPLEEARVSPLDRGFLFGDGVYEVVRCYDGHWFRMADHAERLRRSCGKIGLEGFETAWMSGIADDLVRANDLGPCDAILYLQVTRGADTHRSHFYPLSGLSPTVFATIKVLPKGDLEPPARTVLLEDRRWECCDIKSIALLGHVMAANEARARGADESILIRNGIVTEGSCTNVAIVDGDQVITHPESGRILSGITRKVALEICAELGIPVIERAFGLDELKRAGEVFLMGTTHEIWPVVSVDGQPLPPVTDQTITGRLRTRFSELARSASLPG